MEDQSLKGTNAPKKLRHSQQTNHTKTQRKTKTLHCHNAQCTQLQTEIYKILPIHLHTGTDSIIYHSQFKSHKKIPISCMLRVPQPYKRVRWALMKLIILKCNDGTWPKGRWFREKNVFSTQECSRGIRLRGQMVWIRLYKEAKCNQQRISEISSTQKPLRWERRHRHDFRFVSTINSRQEGPVCVVKSGFGTVQSSETWHFSSNSKRLQLKCDLSALISVVGMWWINVWRCWTLIAHSWRREDGRERWENEDGSRS